MIKPMRTNKYKKVSKKGRDKIIIASIKGQNLNQREVEDIQNGVLQSVLPLEVEVKKNAFKLNYDITNYMSLEQYLHTIVNREKYAKLMLQILEIIRSMSEAYYNPQNLLLEIDKVFFNPSTEKIFFVFVPILYYDSGSSLKDFLMQIIYHTTFDSAEDTSYAGECLDILQKNVNFSVVELEEYLRSLLLDINTKIEEVNNASRPLQKVYNPFTSIEKNVTAFEQREVADEQKRDRNISMKGKSTRMTESLSSIGSSDTVLLGAAEKSYIKQLRTGKTYYLDGMETTIGKAQCQIAIKDNSAVSKYHAVIQKLDGKCYLVDKKSTNGTKVNGKKIASDEPILLNDETQFELANEKFIFYQ